MPSRSGKLSFGSSGVGSASHLSGALFGRMAGVDLLHVPYRGTGPAVTDLLGGRITMMFSPAVVVTPHIATGKLRVIGTTGSIRSALFPDYPTVAEGGLAGYQSLGWFGLFAPASTPRLNKISMDTSGADDAGCPSAVGDRRRACAVDTGWLHGVRELRHRHLSIAAKAGINWRSSRVCCAPDLIQRPEGRLEMAAGAVCAAMLRDTTSVAPPFMRTT
jgi:hypothetical protein